MCIRDRAQSHAVLGDGSTQNGDLIGGRLCSLQSGGGVCHDEVKRNSGKYKFDDAVRFQKG